MIEYGSIQILILGKRIYGIVTFGDDVVVQPFFKVACTISLLFASHEIVTVIINILLDKSVNEFCFTAKFGILNHCVDDVLTLLFVVLAIRIEVFNQLQDIGNIDDVAMQKFQAEINIAHTSCGFFKRAWLTNHAGIVLWYVVCRWLLFVLHSKRIVYIKILAAEVHKLLFCHSEVGSILLKLVIHLYLCVFFDDVTESEDKLLLVVLTLQIVHIVRFGIMLQEVLCQFLIALLDIIKWWAHNIFKIIAVAEKFDGLVHLAFQVTEANHLTETLLLVQHTVGTAERLQ